MPRFVAHRFPYAPSLHLIRFRAPRVGPPVQLRAPWYPPIWIVTGRRPPVRAPRVAPARRNPGPPGRRWDGEGVPRCLVRVRAPPPGRRPARWADRGHGPTRGTPSVSSGPGSRRVPISALREPGTSASAGPYCARADEWLTTVGRRRSGSTRRPPARPPRGDPHGAT